MNKSDVPTVHDVSKQGGVAGQVSYTARVQYPGEETASVTFTGSVYGGPVVMITPGNGLGVFVTEPGRFGARLDASWVARFFAASV